MECPKCSGEGRIANSEDGEPWSQWEKLPPGSDIAVKIGLIKPIVCPNCDGKGWVFPFESCLPHSKE
jgi:RecJ-like exonuclease